MLELIALTPVLTGIAIGAGAGAAGIAFCRYFQVRRMARASVDLQNVENRWRSLVEITPNAVFLHVDGCIVFANRAMATMMGAPDPARLVGMNVVDVLHPDERAKVGEIRDRMAGDGDAIDFLPIRYRALDGRDVWVESGAAILPWDGRDAHMVVAHDVTDRHAAEQALRDSEARYRAVVEDQTELIARYHTDGTLTFVNDAYCRFFGVTPDEVLGLPFKSRVSEAEHAEVDAVIARLVAGADTELRDRRVVRPDGEVLWIQWTSRAIRDNDGNLLEIQAVGREVTEQRRAAMALAESEARLRSIIDLAPVQIFVRDSGGRFLLVNQAVADLYGTTVEALTGRNQQDFHEDKQEMARFLGTDRAVLASGERMTIPEQTFRDRHGRTRYVETVKAALTIGGKSVVIGIGIDITERREAMAQLQQAQKMEAVGQLTGGIAHDFNNLLAVILGNVQLLEREITDNGELRPLAAAAIDATRRGAALTRQLLAFSRQQPLEPGVISLNRLIARSGELLSRSLGETYRVSWELAPELWTTLADSVQLESAILNLVINAGQAMAGGGPIVIRTRNAKLASRDVAGLSDVAAGDYVAVSVTDIGTGMAPKVVARAFDPFFTTKSDSGGSGLGLSMVYGFVRQSGGYATIDSEQGKGTTVTLYLPRHDGAPGDTREAGAGETNGAVPDGVVLVVEDDPDVREIAVKLLERMGYRVRAAANGPDALRQFEAEPDIDLLFTDMVLPDGMSGSDLAIALRDRRGDLPILFTSGNTEVNPEEESRLSGRYAFLRKPYLAEELAFKLQELNLNGQ